MSPNDPKIQYPLKAFFWHRTMTIRDSMNRELFKMDVMRPSIEAWKELQEWADRFCKALNEQYTKEFNEASTPWPAPISGGLLMPEALEVYEEPNGHTKKKGNPWGRKGKPK